MITPGRKKALGAAALWFMVAIMLLVWGVVFVGRAEAAHEQAIALLCVIGVAAGLLKGLLVLQIGARRTLARIRDLPAEAGFLRIYSPAYALLIPFMMGLGIGLRHLAADGHLGYRIVAAIYFGISAALCVGTRPYFHDSI